MRQCKICQRNRPQRTLLGHLDFAGLANTQPAAEDSQGSHGIMIGFAVLATRGDTPNAVLEVVAA